MEEKNKILLKRLLIAVLIIVIISIVATIGIGNYFVNYALLRTGNGGDREVKNNKTPILFIHGDADDFVPEYMCEELYEAANCKKDKLIIHDAGHTDSKYKEPETYYNKIFEFLGNI